MKPRLTARRVCALAARAVFAAGALWVFHVDARRLPRVDASAAVDAAPVPAAVALPRPASVAARAGVPTFLWGDAARAALRSSDQDIRPSPKRGLDSVDAARAHLEDLREIYGLDRDEISALPVRDLQRLPGGASIVRFGQEIDGVEVFRGQANILLDRERNLVALAGSLQARRRSARSARARSRAAAARPRRGARRLRVPAGRGGSPAGGRRARLLHALRPARGCPQRRRLGPGRGGRVKRVWFRLGSDLVAAFYVETQVRDGVRPHSLDSHAYVIAADDARLLYRHNQTAHAAFAYRVYAEPQGRLPAAARARRTQRISAPDRRGGRLPAAERARPSGFARQPAVQPQRPVAAARRHAHDRQQRRGVREPGRPGRIRTGRSRRVQSGGAADRRSARLHQRAGRLRSRLRRPAGACGQPRAGDGRGDEPVLHGQLPPRLVLRRRVRRGVGQRAERATTGGAASVATPSSRRRRTTR